MQVQRTYTRTHPLTGEQLTPIGFTSAGKAIWPIMGGSEPSVETGSDSGNSGAGPEQGTTSGATDSSDSGAEKTGSTVAQSEYDALMRRMQAADKRASEEAERRKQLEDRDKGELEKAQEKTKELEQSVQAKDQEIMNLRLQNAFLTDTSYTWHDPGDVLKFIAGDDTVTIDDNGNVQGMKAALDKLAKSKPYLVKQEPGDNSPGKSGSDMNGRKDKNEPDAAALRNKYPALRRG